MPKNSSSRLPAAVRAIRVTCALLAGALPALPAHAQQTAEPVRRAVTAFLAQRTATLPGNTEIHIGEIDPHNMLPPCTALEAFLPSGTRAWGQISVGVRCNAPAPWTAYVPAQVVVMGDYLVTAQPLRAGQIVGPDDLERRHGDIAAQPPNTLTDTVQAVGHPARYAVAAGSTLRAQMLRLPLAVRQGQNVKVVGSGNGFTVSNGGRALNGAAEGDAVRVRLDSGQVVSGTAHNGGIVEVQF